MRIGSLFTGIGLIDLAFEYAGFEIAWQVEIDDFCNQILNLRYPGIPRYGDIATVRGNDLRPVDGLVGGFPCQDISAAGQGAGIVAGARSGLWFEYARLIGELRPRFVFVENVPAITSRDGTIVIGDLASLGYDARWGIISAADAGAPHLRERWWCVAYRNRHGFDFGSSRSRFTVTYSRSSKGGKSKSARNRNVGHTRQPRLAQRQSQRDHTRTQQSSAQRTGDELVYATDSGLPKPNQPKRYTLSTKTRTRMVPQFKRQGRWSAKSRLGRAADGRATWMDRPNHPWPARPNEPQYTHEPPRVTERKDFRAARLKALGNAVVPQVVYPLALAILEYLEV